MPLIRPLAVLAAGLLALAGCATPAEPPAAPPAAEAPAMRPMVILISIDGFHPDYLDRGITPTLSRLAAEGARGAMRPSFPTKTFPNHYTLVTGLTPDHHGVVNNTMEDPAIPGVFRLSDKAVTNDPRWWQEGEPIWISAEKAGMETAVVFWPGSEEEIQGRRPDRYLAFDQSMPGDARVDRLLTWIDDRRPDFAALYFDIVDTAGHHHGPNSDEVNAALAETDAALGRLVEGLRARGLDDEARLVIVSDHGMAATAPDRVIRFGPAVTSGAARVVYFGALAGLEPAPGREAEAEAELLAPQPHMTCWRREDIPARFGFGTHRRVPRIVCLPEVGWQVLTQAARFRGGGEHGYDHDDPTMRALFVLHGPGVAPGQTVPTFDNTDVQPLLGRLLGIPVPAGDGDAAVFEGVVEPD